VPFLAIFDFGDEGVEESAFSLGLVFLILAVVGEVLSFNPRATGWRRAVGAVVLAIWLLFTIRMVPVFWDPDEAGEFFTQWYGLGAILGLIGGILLVVGRRTLASPAPMVPPRRRPRGLTRRLAARLGAALLDP
jgi:hypothetical protein